MKILITGLALAATLLAESAMAWGDHRFPSYLAFERMPEIVQAAAVKVEPLSTFLRAEETALQKHMADEEAWSVANLDWYPPLPPALAFRANPSHGDAARKLAFLMALRIAPNAPLSLYFQPDIRKPRPPGQPLPHGSVNTLPLSAGVAFSYFPLNPGQMIDALSVLATATEEPDTGLDINLWSDSRSEWGKALGFGPQPFGNPSLAFSSQAPFHMGFYHESPLIYMAADFTRHTLPLHRQHQFTKLSMLAFRTGHPYWGWRFAGMALHYLQDLTQPFHASLSPGNSAIELIGINTLAMLGLSKWKDDMVILLSNRHLALEHYQAAWLRRNASLQLDGELEVALHSMARDSSYPAWSDAYVRDVVSAQAATRGAALVRAMLDSVPATYVNDPQFDFGPKADAIALNDEVEKTASAASRQGLEATVTELLGDFGAHSRNALRGILRSTPQH